MSQKHDECCHPIGGTNRNNVSVKILADQRRNWHSYRFISMGVNESGKKFSFDDDLSNLIFKFFGKFDRFRLCIVFDSRRSR